VGGGEWESSGRVVVRDVGEREGETLADVGWERDSALMAIVGGWAVG